MKKRTKLQAAILAALASSSYANDSCLMDVENKDPLEVFQCFDAKLNTQQNRIAELERGNQRLDRQQYRIAELEKENLRLRQKTDAINVSSNGNVAIGRHLPYRVPNVPVEKLEVNGGILIFGDVGNWPVLMTINGNPKTGAMKFTTRWDGFHFDTGETPNAFYINQNGRVGIGTTAPSEKLQVNGNVKANAFRTGDIFFEKDGETLWQMFEDEHGLYVKHLKTGETYRFVLEKVQ
jgi:hypothetical protein